MILQPTEYNIELCASVLRAGGVVAMPTETVYGLAASIRREDGLKRIFEVKGRPSDNPLIVHVATVDDAVALTLPAYEAQVRRLASIFWPGPLTCVVPAAASVSRLITAHLDTVAVRMPQHPLALALITSLGAPVAAPSANRSGRPSPTRAQHVIDDFGEDVQVLDGGACAVGVESTVVRLDEKGCTILRPGTVTYQQLCDALNMPVMYTVSEDDLRASPGTRYRHYAPACPVVLCTSEEDLRARIASHTGPVMVLAEHVPDVHDARVIHAVLSEPSLYAELRRADDLHLEAILVLCDGAVQRREALMNRLTRASASHKGAL